MAGLASLRYRVFMKLRNVQFLQRQNPHALRPQVVVKRTCGDSRANRQGASTAAIFRCQGCCPASQGRNTAVPVTVSAQHYGRAPNYSICVEYGNWTCLRKSAARCSWRCKRVGREIRAPRRAQAACRSYFARGCSLGCDYFGGSCQSHRALFYPDTLPCRQTGCTEVDSEYLPATLSLRTVRGLARPRSNRHHRYLALEGTHPVAVRPCCQSPSHGTSCRGG